jgi:hypothetical protein
MKKLILSISLLISSIFYSQQQLTVADFLKDKYPNWEYVSKMPYIELIPKPINYQGTLTEVTAGKNKFTYKSDLKKENLLNRLNHVLNNNQIFSAVKVKDSGETNYVISSDIISEFSLPFAGYVYTKNSYSDIIIRVKDYSYQIEIVNFSVGKNEWQRNTYKHILYAENQNFNAGTVGAINKKEIQQDWNNTFIDYETKFQLLNNKVNENNSF